MPVIHVDSEAQLDAIMRQTASEGKTLLLMFTASWCGPCKRIKPVIENSLSVKYIRQFTVVFIDVDEAEELTESYAINSMPSFVFVRGANRIKRLEGANVEELESLMRMAGGISHPDLFE